MFASAVFCMHLFARRREQEILDIIRSSRLFCVANIFCPFLISISYSTAFIFYNANIDFYLLRFIKFRICNAGAKICIARDFSSKCCCCGKRTLLCIFLFFLSALLCLPTHILQRILKNFCKKP